MEDERVTYFAETDHRNKRAKFGIKAKDRTRHVYMIGKTGMGKSTLLENMAVQDIQNGNGLAFLDPHGATAEKLLDYIPEHRVDDVLYFAPFDTEYPVSFNVMEDVGESKRHLVLDGLMSAFKKIWFEAWSARMEYILGNTILALLEYPDSTILGINRMYSDKEYRNKVVGFVTDPIVKTFWMQEFAGYTERYAQDATPAIQNKIGQFTSNPLVRNIIGQVKSSFDIRAMMDEKKIIIVNLSKGRVGEQNANLLGSMLITKIYLAAMSRADLPAEDASKLPNFYLYVDEFQSFANESFTSILSEARKYKLNLTIAHQYIEQMSETVRAAVFGNVGTMISFRIGSYDAMVLEKEFAPQFTSEDMVNLGFAQIYLKLMVDGISSTPFSAVTLPPIELPRISYRDVVKARSREQFSMPRADVEARIRAEQMQSSQLEKSPASKGEKRRDFRRGGEPRSAAKPSPAPEKTSVNTTEHTKSLREAVEEAVGKRDRVQESVRHGQGGEKGNEQKGGDRDQSNRSEPKEISKEKLKKLLHVDKKNIT
jgi:energy-coupling factor transporter ATP-binding protein EcfA2